MLRSSQEKWREAQAQLTPTELNFTTLKEIDGKVVELKKQINSVPPQWEWGFWFSYVLYSKSTVGCNERVLDAFSINQLLLRLFYVDIITA